VVGKTFRHFREPWFFLETEADYSALFERAGFRVLYVEIKKTMTEHTPGEVFRIFDSGASAGYLNQRYDIRIDSNYIEKFKRVVKESFQRQAGDRGLVSIVFNRLYIVGVKAER
jgi:hypothetical protein